jgi:uncharacterized protein YlxW (UPF0749 family)
MALETANDTFPSQALSEEAPAAIVPARPVGDHGWVWYVTALSVVLGVMLALAIRTTAHMSSTGIPATRFGISAAVLGAYKEEAERQQATIQSLNEKLREYETRVEERIKSVEGLKKQFMEFKAAAGLAPVEGPGLKIFLKDSPKEPLPNLDAEQLSSYMIHDQDLNGLLNELKSAGAEAMAISGADGKQFERIVATSAARCVGPTAVVNGVSLSAPYTVLVIGNGKNLRRALEMPNGFIETRGLNVLDMISIEESDHLVLPEYSGSSGLKYARPTPEDK